MNAARGTRPSPGAFLRRHEPFLLVLLLFVAFRLLAVLLMRPGGFFADASDYDFYMDWAEQSARGYVTFETLWTAYPPLFARLMLPVAELSARMPPWIDPRLAFHSLFGAFLLIFETGNLILIYRLSGKLTREERATVVLQPGLLAASTPGRTVAPIHPVIFYALLFVPVHTLLGWFEAMPLFFLLLALDLLLVQRTRTWSWGWPLSAVAMALGFLVKLTPMVLLPVAIRTLGARVSLDAIRHEWFNRRSPGNLLRPAIYTLIAALVIIGGGWLLLGGETSLALSSLRVNSLRPPWQSLWALLDGYWGFGWVPLDMRNLDGLERTLWQSRLPWPAITVGFLALYLWLYTRRYDWARVRTVVAFTGVSAIWLFLYSKGWSPQFLVWVLAFLALLMPTPRGIALALALSAVNVVEAYVYLILLPDARWLLVGTVLLRTLLLLAVAAEFLTQILPARVARSTVFADEPGGRGPATVRATSWALVAATVIAALVATPFAATAYGARRLAEHPCRAAVEFLRAEAAVSPNRTLAMTQIEIWRALYPWLRDDYTLRVVDGYTSNDRPVDEVISERLAEFAGTREFWWLTAAGEDSPWSAPSPDPTALPFLDGEGVQVLESQRLGACQVERVVRLENSAAEAEADVDGGPIRLLRWETGAAQPGAALPLVLYWQADAPVATSYTVFTQLLDADGALVAQQDNLPVGGLAPTTTWEPGNLIRDPYLLPLPETPGNYRLLVGLYDASGTRALLRLADDRQVDALDLNVMVPSAPAASRPE